MRSDYYCNLLVIVLTVVHTNSGKTKGSDKVYPIRTAKNLNKILANYITYWYMRDI